MEGKKIKTETEKEKREKKTGQKSTWRISSLFYIPPRFLFRFHFFLSLFEWPSAVVLCFGRN